MISDIIVSYISKLGLHPQLQPMLNRSAKERPLKKKYKKIKKRGERDLPVSGEQKILQRVCYAPKMNKLLVPSKQPVSKTCDKENDASGNTQIVHNRELLHFRQGVKPNRINFLTKISNVYDLVLAGVDLPPFVSYFLGEALFAVQEQKIGSRRLHSPSWKLNQFKLSCQYLYEQSDESDLKIFMNTSLPTLNWIDLTSQKSSINDSRNSSVYSSFKNSINRKIHESRSTISKQKSRLTYFRDLSKKQKTLNQVDASAVSAVDRLNQKLDRYLRNCPNKILSTSIID